MAYFLKQTPNGKRTYLSIVESYYSPSKKGTAHRTYKSLTSIETLRSKGIEDPVSFYQKQVDELNRKREKEKVREISERSPQRFLGYFPARSILEKLDIRRYVNFFKLSTNFDFDLYDVIASLIYARLVRPCSKSKTYHEVLPYLFEEFDFSYDQLLAGLGFIGNDYEKFVELFTEQLRKVYGIRPDVAYFDCTNFYFEIDREDDLRRKGPSKENRKDPIVGLGLLLDGNILPVGMRIYPGNESERPFINQTVNELKEHHGIKGKTIRVADKGLNSAKNIYDAKMNGDGYIFSKSVRQLSEKEQQWVLLENDYRWVLDKKGKKLYRYKECIDKFPYKYTDDDGKEHTFGLREKRVVTYNPTLARKKVYEIDRMVEKARGLCHSKAKREEYGESSKYVRFVSKDGKKACTVLNEDKIEKDRKLAGYNLIVTSETRIKALDLYKIYHNLWHIEESFKIMKSDLDSRPAFMKREDTIKGHFLICYLSVLIERIFEFNVMENRYSHEAIFEFFRDFKVVKCGDRYLNISTSRPLIRDLKEMTDLPIMNYLLTETQIKRILNWKI